MISKSQLQFVRSLHQKKFRSLHSKFLAEGPVLVAEALKSDFIIETIYTNGAGKKRLDLVQVPEETEVVEVSDAELQRLSLLKQPHEMLAVLQMRQSTLPEEFNSLILALDHIADPGNLGTIIRIADWFGIKNIICSDDTVDVYNPKVVQATMGSLFRVEVAYASLPSMISEIKKKNEGFKIYGAMLSGKNIYKEKPEEKGMILMGNETRGISEELQNYIDVPLTIPSFNSNDSPSAESLNVAVATAIFCSEFRRQN